MHGGGVGSTDDVALCWVASAVNGERLIALQSSCDGCCDFVLDDRTEAAVSTSDPTSAMYAYLMCAVTPALRFCKHLVKQVNKAIHLIERTVISYHQNYVAFYWLKLWTTNVVEDDDAVACERDDRIQLDNTANVHLAALKPIT